MAAPHASAVGGAGAPRPTPVARQPGRLGAPSSHEKALRVIFVRHGQSANNALAGPLGAQSGRVPDPALTASGAAEAAAVGAYVSKHLKAKGAADSDEDAGSSTPPVARLYASGFRRAMETAQPISDALELPIRVWPEICEVGAAYENLEDGTTKGSPGMSRSEMARLFPGCVVPDSVTEAGWNRRERKETDDEARDRASDAIYELRKRAAAIEESETHIVVSHSDFLNILFQELVAQDVTGRAQFVFNTCSLSAIDLFPGGGLHVVAINSRGHLPGALF